MNWFFKTPLRVIATSAIGLVVLLGTQVGSYVSTAADIAGDAVRDEVPTEFELHRAENLIEAIEPQLHTCKKDLARCEIQLEDLEEEIAELEVAIVDREETLRVAVSGANPPAMAATVGLRPSTSEAMEAREAARLARLLSKTERTRELLASKRKLRERQRAAVAAARERLDAVTGERQRLEDVIADLRVRQMHVEAMEAMAPGLASVDATPIDEAGELLSSIEERIRVRERYLESELDEREFVDEPTEDLAVVVADARHYLDTVASPSER